SLAEPARDCVVGPQPERHFAYLVKAHDFERRRPEPRFLAHEIPLNPPERNRLVTQRHHRVVAWTAKSEVHLEPIRRPAGRIPQDQNHCRNRCQPQYARTMTHTTPPHSVAQKTSNQNPDAA